MGHFRHNHQVVKPGFRIFVIFVGHIPRKVWQVGNTEYRFSFTLFLNRRRGRPTAWLSRLTGAGPLRGWGCPPSPQLGPFPPPAFLTKAGRRLGVRRADVNFGTSLSIRMEGFSRSIEPLVPVSFTHYCASTPGLSTWWSSTALKRDLVLRGVSRLDAFSGYPGRT